jgi:plasmid stabilization system protein ParE
MKASQWEMRLSTAAASDFRQIVNWTGRRFGATQAKEYGKIIKEAVAALRAGPQTAGLKLRSDLGEALYTLHIARSRWRGRHLLLLGIAEDYEEQRVDVVRILHDAMDLAWHLPVEEEE